MPRHPPCTLSSLTTITDHRHDPLGKGHAVRTAGNGSDQSITRSLPHTRGRYSLARGRDHASFAKKVLDDPRPKRKRPCLHRRPKPTAENQMPGVADLARPARHGGYRATRPPKPSVEPLFTCQRTFDTDQKSSRKRPDRFEAGQALIVNSRKAVHEGCPSRSPFRARGRADKYVRVRTRTDSK